MEDPLAAIKGLRHDAQKVNVIEELLLALVGCTGDAFMDTGSSRKAKIADHSSCAFKTNPDLHFISPPDRSAS